MVWGNSTHATGAPLVFRLSGQRGGGTICIGDAMEQCSAAWDNLAAEERNNDLCYGLEGKLSELYGLLQAADKYEKASRYPDADSPSVLHKSLHVFLPSTVNKNRPPLPPPH